MTALLLGLLTGFSLIVAIGPQNAFVLRQGVRGEHIAAVVAVCALSDIALIAAGTAGLGALLGEAPALLTVLSWGGAAYLLWYAFTCFRAALHPGALHADASKQGAGLRATVATTLALTWLNPHVYLDTVVMIGALAHGYGDLRWWFAAGVMGASIVWFTGLGFGARALAGVLGRPEVWRWIDAAIGVVMVIVAWRLVTSVHG